MRVVVTGAGGFVGSRLCRRLLADERYASDRFTFIDRSPGALPADRRAEWLNVDLAADGAHRDVIGSADVLFHLAAIPGGAAESDYELSRQVNLELALSVLEAAASRRGAMRFVYASSIAVFGAPLPAAVDDDTAAFPSLTYGAHKVMVEMALVNLSRLARIDGWALRLPGIVARPGAGTGLRSAFLSGLFHACASRESLVIPTGPEATVWIMSASRAVDNLLHAAQLPRLPPGARRAITLPTLRVTMRELVDSVSRITGADSSAIRFAPDAGIEAQFGRLPPLNALAALKLGFADDGNLDELVLRALDDAGLRSR